MRAPYDEKEEGNVLIQRYIGDKLEIYGRYTAQLELSSTPISAPDPYLKNIEIKTDYQTSFNWALDLTVSSPWCIKRPPPFVLQLHVADLGRHVDFCVFCFRY